MQIWIVPRRRPRVHFSRREGSGWVGCYVSDSCIKLWPATHHHQLPRHSELYAKISQACARRSSNNNLQGNLNGVKKILAGGRRTTGIQFMCFRQPKSKCSLKFTAGKPRAKGTEGSRTTGGCRPTTQTLCCSFI
ncbi:hypothetical protein EDD16DRAFT_221674 [Pisolithus croceorrhizus]|nr:hypothetical protein EV401DRAFT_105414 [Pisolithus croceorrhizus]KAI6127964.1 hypothetical protein EDD16DRAFT_221674 [Pisolithus croceorrhizus]